MLRTATRMALALIGLVAIAPAQVRAADTDSERAGAKASKRAPAAMKNRVAFGAMRTVSGMNGLFVRWFASDRLSIGLDLGVAVFSHRDTDENGDFGRVRTVGVFGVGPEAFFWPVQGDRSNQVYADFGLGLRVLTFVGFLGRLEDERPDTLDIPVEVDIEIPAAVQLFIGRNVAIHPEFGVVFRAVPGSREPDGNGEADSNPGTGAAARLGAEDGPGFGFELGNHAGLFMGIGVSYVFG